MIHWSNEWARLIMMLMNTTSILFALVAIGSTGCANLAGLDDFEGAASEPNAGGGEGGGFAQAGAGGDGGDGGDDAEGGAGGEACETASFEAFAEADTVLFPNDCNGANYFGGMGFANIGQGRGLFRFPLNFDVALAFEQGRVVSADLVLTRDIDCLGPGQGCPASAGRLSAHPLTNDWEEGPEVYETHAGADWCRRGGQGSTQWQTPGASGPLDSGDESGAIEVGTNELDVEMTLDPQLHRPFVEMMSGVEALSVMVEGQNGASFVAATKEEFEPSEPPARLRVVYCVAP